MPENPLNTNAESVIFRISEYIYQNVDISITGRMCGLLHLGIYLAANYPGYIYPLLKELDSHDQSAELMAQIVMEKFPFSRDP